MSERVVVAEGFKALSDPIRWSILTQVAEGDELACSRLEETLPVARPTISYHTKVLVQAGLMNVRKRGRHSFYALRQDVLHMIVDELRTLTIARGAEAECASVTALSTERGERGAVTEGAPITC